MYQILVALLFASTSFAIADCQSTLEQYSSVDSQQYRIDKNGKIEFAPGFDRTRSQKTKKWHRINYTTRGFKPSTHTVTMFYDDDEKYIELKDERSINGNITDISSYKFDHSTGSCEVDQVELQKFKEKDDQNGRFVTYDKKTCDDLIKHFKKITTDKTRYESCIKDIFQGRQILHSHEQRLNKNNSQEPIQLQAALFGNIIKTQPLAQSEVYLANCIAHRPDDTQLNEDLANTIQILNDLGKKPDVGEQ